MLRLSLALLLVCASAQAFAQNGRGAPGNPGACQETEAVARDHAESNGPAPARANAARSKYSRPATSSTTTSGGGGGDVLPSTRGAKWHSFLPGMFR